MEAVEKYRFVPHRGLIKLIQLGLGILEMELPMLFIFQ